MTDLVCHVCQTPIVDQDPVRTVAGEPAHSDCLQESELVEDITAGDVEGVRQTLFQDPRLEEASAEYAAGWVDALIAMDMALTNPDDFRD
ncbi:hypothetical protein [Natrialba aegyptia]|uniref:Uncharacterized protein n=1 Tax=Natrialba aegyptia DSM 13077 TaxID=1227491 RepID=M0B4Z1_9EURY|nr:hypothetical protein [Natrialba aegyptia]ELZ05577.1 hypothetical protein C480_10365 [Natrialba aegyptia DSM 13077]